MLILLLPATEVELDGQTEHTMTDVDAICVAYVLLPHMVQGLDPVLGLYVPATHGLQGPPSGPVWPALQVQLVMTELPTSEFE